MYWYWYCTWNVKVLSFYEFSTSIHPSISDHFLRDAAGYRNKLASSSTVQYCTGRQWVNKIEKRPSMVATTRTTCTTSSTNTMCHMETHIQLEPTVCCFCFCFCCWLCCIWCTIFLLIIDNIAFIFYKYNG